MCPPVFLTSNKATLKPFFHSKDVYIYSNVESSYVFNPSDLGQDWVLESENSGHIEISRKMTSFGVCLFPNSEKKLELICSPFIVCFTAKERLFLKKKRLYELTIKLS